MSMPKIEKQENSIDREQSVNNLIESVALIETGLSHIINAEGEKLQKVIKVDEEKDVPLDDLLKVNNSTEKMINTISKLEMILQSKLESSKDLDIIGTPGPQGEKGDPGENGLTPYIGVNGNWWIGTTDTGVTAQGPTGLKGDTGPQGDIGPQGPSGIVPDIYHFVVPTSAFGYKINVGKNIYYTVAKDGDSALKIMLQGTMSAIGMTTVDINWILTKNGITSGGSHENILINNMYFTLTTGIQMNTSDWHKTIIRSKNARTNLWELYEVNLLASMNNQRIDAWVYKIYDDYEENWQ